MDDNIWILEGQLLSGAYLGYPETPTVILALLLR